MDSIFLQSDGASTKVSAVHKRYKVRCYTGLHSDTEASLTIYTATNSWYCHGCQSSGDAGNVKDGSYVRQRRRLTVS